MNPLALLPIEDAEAITVLRLVACGTLCIWFWDFVTGIADDVRLISEFGMTPSCSCYILSKVATAANVITEFLITAAPIGNCHIFSKVVTGIAITAAELSSLLFFFRVKAVFNHSRVIIGVFLALWIVQAISSYTTSLLNSDAIHIGTTMYCIATAESNYGYLPRAQSNTIKAFFIPIIIGQVSKVIFQTGQLYFLASILADIMMSAAWFSRSWVPVLRTLLSVPVVPLLNIFSCKAYGTVMLGMVGDPKVTWLDSTGQVGTLQFAQCPSFVVRSRIVQDRSEVVEESF